MTPITNTTAPTSKINRRMFMADQFPIAPLAQT
jgi:hypothetical protein